MIIGIDLLVKSSVSTFAGGMRSRQQTDRGLISI